MLKDISNVFGSAMPAASMICFTAAGVFVGRKFCQATFCKMGSIISELMGKQVDANEWNKSSNEYLILAKKDIVRDVTAAASFIVLGLFSKYVGEALLVNEEKEAEKKKQQNNLVVTSSIISTIWENKIAFFSGLIIIPHLSVFLLDRQKYFEICSDATLAANSLSLSDAWNSYVHGIHSCTSTLIKKQYE